MESSNKKTLAKNTLLLYVRTLLSMLISLYTSRIVLQALSIENYGIYNIVGGFVGVFSVVSATLTSPPQTLLLSNPDGVPRHLNNILLCFPP